MEIKLKVQGQTVFRDPEDTQELVAGSRGFLTAQMEYDGLWNGLARMVIWTNGRTSAATVDRDGTVEVPWEVLAEGSLSVTVVGTGEGGKRRLVTKAMTEPLTVLPCGETLAEEALEATPSAAEQMLDMLRQALDALDEAKALREAAEQPAAVG